jgi:tyrosinase
MHFPRTSRRSFLALLGSAAGLPPFAVWVARLASGQQRSVRVRHEASSPAGKRMLDLYRTAVGLMQDKLPLHHPHSWRFQANIHGYPKSDIDEVFRAASREDAAVRAHRVLALGSETGEPTASGLWATCPHEDPHFLPWHRLYLHYFEQIVERVVQRQFALPYWGYMSDANRHLPEEFRDKTINGAPNKLYFPARNPYFLANGLKDVPGLMPDRKAEILGNAKMLTNIWGHQGFSEDLRMDIHNKVHNSVGMPGGMSDFKFAARDPIFWLHHATVDMLWESWRRPNANGVSHLDPPHESELYKKAYAFVDANGTRNADTYAQFALQAAWNLNCSYDELLIPPPLLLGAGPGIPSLDSPTTVQAGDAPENRITGSGDTVAIALRPSVPESVALEVNSNPVTRYYLELTLRAQGYPGIYRVYSRGQGKEVLIGAFDFFGVGGDHHGVHPPAPQTIDRKIDITGKVRDGTINTLRNEQLTIRAGNLEEPVDIRIVSQIKNVAR